MKYLVGILLAMLLVLHQDYWQWEDSTLVFGFLPWSLAYHGLLSLSASAVWLLAVQACWPQRLEPHSRVWREGDN